MTLRFGKLCFPGSNGLYKWTFWVYMDGFNREKDPIVMFMGHIGVPTKKLVKGNECFISAFCVAPATLILLFTSPSGISGCCMLSDNSFSCFRRKAF